MLLPNLSYSPAKISTLHYNLAFYALFTFLFNKITFWLLSVVPPTLKAWYSKKLRILRDEISKQTSDYQVSGCFNIRTQSISIFIFFSKFQLSFELIKDFHRRSLCAISLHTFFRYCGNVATPYDFVYLFSRNCWVQPNPYSIGP